MAQSLSYQRGIGKGALVLRGGDKSSQKRDLREAKKRLMEMYR
jgi:hypothetical protein